jgi:hypothetical protein
MKTTLRNEIFETFCERMADLYPDIPGNVSRSIATNLAATGMAMYIENDEKLRELMSDAILARESHVNMFTKHIEHLQYNTKKIMEVWKEQGMVYLDHDRVKNRKVMKARSSVLQESVNFMNELNDLTIEFYKKVYKVEDNDFNIQSTLF